MESSLLRSKNGLCEFLQPVADLVKLSQGMERSRIRLSINEALNHKLAARMVNNSKFL